MIFDAPGSYYRGCSSEVIRTQAYPADLESQVSKADILRSRAKKAGLCGLAIIVAVAALPLVPAFLVGVGVLFVIQHLKDKASKEDAKIQNLMRIRAEQGADRAWMREQLNDSKI